ncbi:unnamed protein product [[Actinomadura] parvosata subsp. kistnae]|nr:unnamed protein product [Actinomadura parvosata subsp. kistnae]
MRHADLTAQAKIRNAAAVHVARDGFQKTRLRTSASTSLPIRRSGSRTYCREGRCGDEPVLSPAVRGSGDVRYKGSREGRR